MHTVSSWSWPTQTRPPNAGAGFVQLRRRVFIAKPQVCEHADQADQAVHPPWMVQFVTLTRAPVQALPSCRGGGLLHSLVWHWHVSPFCKFQTLLQSLIAIAMRRGVRLQHQMKPFLKKFPSMRARVLWTKRLCPPLPSRASLSLKYVLVGIVFTINLTLANDGNG